jgi:hypothetical protein
MQQLETRKKEGVPALKLVGVSDERLRYAYLSLHSVDEAGQLCCADVLVNVYGWLDKKVATVDQKTLEYELAGSKVVVPRELRDGMLYLHHYSRMASHASWVDMMDGVQARRVIPGKG